MKDINIYYDTLESPNVINCPCTRWDASEYLVTIETWMSKSQLQTLRDNITPGAADVLYNVLGSPHYIDKTWTDSNTIKISTVTNEGNIFCMREEKLIFVKNISDTPIPAETNSIKVKIEGYISGGRL